MTVVNVVKSKKFRLNSCPKKPVRKKAQRCKDSIENTLGSALLSILQEMKARGVDLNHVWVEVESTEEYYGQHSASADLSWTEDESKEDFDKRMSIYKRKLATYNKWAEDNKEAISERKEQDEAEKEEKRVAADEREVSMLELRLKKLKRQSNKQ